MSYHLRKSPRKSVVDQGGPSTSKAQNDSTGRAGSSKTHANTSASDTSESEDFSPSESEYSASESESDSEEDEEEDEKMDVDNDCDESLPESKVPRKLQQTPKKGVTGKSKEYVINSENYFNCASKKKTTISNNKIENLITPKLKQDQLHTCFANLRLSSVHEKAKKKLLEKYRGQFPRWKCLLLEEFSLLLYGLGSKIDIVQQFQRKFLSGYPVVFVNGFFPSLTVKSIFDGIADVLELKRIPASLYDCCSLIQREIAKLENFHLFLIIHNLDGVMLRSSKSQNILSRLASIDQLHLLATIDHINAPLLWDNSRLCRFNFISCDVTTFTPSIIETSLDNSSIVQNSTSLALASIRHVFLSLTSNSKGIYLNIVRYQLENGGKQHYPGYLFKDLYWACREAFLVSSDLGLRSQLTEFVDHKMLKFKRSADGSEHVIIPMAPSVLQQFLDEQNQ